MRIYLCDKLIKLNCPGPLAIKRTNPGDAFSTHKLNAYVILFNVINYVQKH